MSWTRSVYSRMVSEVGYDSDTSELIVKWQKSGRTSIYSDVPEAVALDLANAPSVGSMVNSEIKPAYAHRYG